VAEPAAAHPLKDANKWPRGLDGYCGRRLSQITRQWKKTDDFWGKRRSKAMDGFDRIYDLHKILSKRSTPIPLADILSQMECSRATFNRIKRHMTDFLGAPIAYNRELGGYYYASQGDGHYELPGIWLNQEELHALVLIHGLLADIGSGLLRNQLAPVKRRFEELLAQRAIDPCALADKVRMVGATYRPVRHDQFVKIANALFNEQCLHIQYESRIDGAITQRDISPQRLVHYRGNWYLDSWCHMRKGLRTFALECIRQCGPVASAFKKITATDLDAHFLPTYGIFSAEHQAEAVLLFTPAIARRVRDEEWHPQQILDLRDDGSLVMRLPFNPQSPQELVKDILSYGDEVKVLEPTSLQEQITAKLRRACALYQ
jgi:predicted DNA-binding transcriptional regulator YafY